MHKDYWTLLLFCCAVGTWGAAVVYASLPGAHPEFEVVCIETSVTSRD